VAQRIIDALGLPLDLGGRPTHITVSIGIASYDGGPADVDAIRRFLSRFDGDFMRLFGFPNPGEQL